MYDNYLYCHMIYMSVGLIDFQCLNTTNANWLTHLGMITLWAQTLPSTLHKHHYLA